MLIILTEVAVQVLGNMFMDTEYPPDEDKRSQDAQIHIPAHYLTSQNASGYIIVIDVRIYLLMLYAMPLCLQQ